MHSRFKACEAVCFAHRVQSIIVNYSLIVDMEIGAVVGIEVKFIKAVKRDVYETGKLRGDITCDSTCCEFCSCLREIYLVH